MDASDCDAAIGERGCGAWVCDAGSCTVRIRCSDTDGDGFWTGPDCACTDHALDCDDGDSGVGDSASVSCCNGGTRACKSGSWGLCSGATGESCNGEDDDCNGVTDDLPELTCGLGACRTIVTACTGGTLATCSPIEPATDVDGCNGIDDDCDGAVDEDCPVCIHVAPDGDDAAAASSNGATPFASVQAALDFADTHRDVARRVCVAAGPTCGATATYLGPATQDLTMHEGISLLGKYESSCWTRCEDSSTHLAPQTGRGVVFPSSIAVQTGLDGFAIDHAFDPTLVAGVTVDGARGVMLSDLIIVGPSEPPDTLIGAGIGVDLMNGAEATIAHSLIEGFRSSDAVGVRSVGSKLTLEQNDLKASGSDPCVNAKERLGTTVGFWNNKGVELVDSPGSRITSSLVCGYLRDGRPALEISGRSAGVVVSASEISGRVDNDAGVGALLNDCDGDAPWLVQMDAGLIAYTGYASAIEVRGDCHPVIEASAVVNSTIASGFFGTGIQCGDGTTPSRCVIARNDILGIVSNFLGVAHGTPVWGVGVSCASGSCTKIEQSTIEGLDGYCFGCRPSSYPVVLGGGPVVVRDNTISAGGAGLVNFSSLSISGSTTGSVERNRLYGSFRGYAARFESNVVFGGQCGSAESGRCSAVIWTTSGGVVKNNCIHAGDGCFGEASADADPAVFEGNDLYANGGRMYTDEGLYGSTLFTVAEVNALTDMSVSGTIDTLCSAPPVPP